GNDVPGRERQEERGEDRDGGEHATKRTASPIIIKPNRPSPCLVGCRRRRGGDAAALAVTVAAPVTVAISSPPSPGRSAARRGQPWRHRRTLPGGGADGGGGPRRCNRAAQEWASFRGARSACRRTPTSSSGRSWRTARQSS